MRKILSVALMMMLSMLVLAEWNFRGTANSWASEAMTYNSTTGLYETTQTFGTGDSGGGPRFKIDRYGDWTEAYPTGDYTVNSNTTYDITINPSTHEITATEAGFVDTWYYRGSSNSWAATEMTYNESTGLYEITQTFADGDGGGGPRFKICHDTTWTESYPTGDYTVDANNTYLITFNASTKAITATPDSIDPPVAPTGLTVSGATQSSLVVAWTAASGASSYEVFKATSASGAYTSVGTTSSTSYTVTGLSAETTYYFKATASNSAGTSAMSTSASGTTTGEPVDTWYFRGTANSWGTDLMSFNSSTGLYETTQTFADGDGGGGPRFKICHDTTWTESYPTGDYTVDANNTYLITFNASTKDITATLQESTTVVVSATPGTEETTADSVTVTLTVSGLNAVAKYAVNGDATNGTVYTDGQTITISLANVGDTATLNLYGSNSESSDSASYTYTRIEQTTNINGTMMQYFHWYLPEYDENSQTGLWTQVSANAADLADLGVTALWLPPAYKGDGGKSNVGYGVYDMYDLGEFYQHGSIPTKYGTKDQYINAINSAHANGMQVYGDVVFNHRGGADSTALVDATRVSWSDRNSEQGNVTVEAWVNFDFPGRGNTYSDFKWRWYHFDGVDWNQATSEKAIFRFNGLGKGWDWEVDTENGNYDYLMYADLDMSNPEVVQELKDWGNWYVNFTGVDGFRIDAVKHIKFDFFQDWLGDVRTNTGKELFSVGEYWNYNVSALHNYIEKSGGVMSLFDAPLHMNFYNASNANGNYDMRYLESGTLMGENPSKAVTLVENHDTQPLQALESPVNWWFKQLAYAYILLRNEGYPNVFYADLYGATYSENGNYINMAPVPNLAKLMKARKLYAYGEQYDYLDNADVIGWTRLGDAEHGSKAMAVVMSDRSAGSKYMYTGKANATFYDYTGNRSDRVYTDGSGNANFPCNAGSVSVWVQE